ncbi:hypothetical protein LC040_02390 [Bacillus tianshenii]|nr:hypothetical protein LC040_02390 [Bacillus tianshenii]
MSFKSSINIKFDLGKREFFDRYLPTPAHAEALQGILSGFNNNERKAHIISGPYGTGKSLLGTLISSMTSQTIDEQGFEILIDKFNNVDDAIFDELVKISGSKRNHLPIILNGNEGDFREAILSAIMKAIYQHDLDIVMPGVANKILTTIELWEEQYPKTYKLFLAKLKEQGKDIAVWRVNILNHERSEIDWFKDIFPELTSGAEFVASHLENNFIEQLEYVVSELNHYNMGLFIVYDEFGRFLQSIEANQVHQTMQDLQDIAELADHTTTNSLHIMLITHRNLRQYFANFNEELQNEFQRIEKRYRLYYIDSDNSTFIRLTESILKNLKIKTPEEVKNEMKVWLRKYPLFSELNQVEVEKLVINGTYPIHPVTLHLLPYLSNIFAQNERTLFTFLESKGSGGLMNHIEKSEGYYLPYQLFTYFFNSIDEFLSDNDNSAEILKLYQRVTNRVPSLNGKNNVSLNLLRFMTLWQVTGMQSRIKVTEEFLSFALEKSIEEIQRSLKNLMEYKAVRFNHTLGYWELFEGSSVNLDEIILERLKDYELSTENRRVILESLLNTKYFLANQYNDEKSITRFAEVRIVFSQELKEDTFNQTISKDKLKSDAVIYYVLCDSHDEVATLQNLIKHYSDERVFFSFTKALTYEQISEQVRNYEILSFMLEDEELLKQDKRIKEEIHLKMEDLRHQLKKYLSVYESFHGELTWMHKGKQKKIENPFVMEKKLSVLMNELYPLTPEIRNDSFNRRTINKVQQKAGYKIVDFLLNNYRLENIGITGNGPEYLIYATTFKNNGVDINNLDSIKCVELVELRKKLLGIIENQPSGSLEDLVRVLEDKPFGIRRPLVPILLVGLIRDKWDQLLFYRNDMYVTGLNGETLYRLVDEATEYQYQYFKFDEKYMSFFEKLEEQFSSYIHESVMGRPKVIQLSSALLSWLRSLPRFTQTTEKARESAVEFKNIVRYTEINPQKAMSDLFDLYQYDFGVLIEEKNYLENYLVYLKNELEIEIMQNAQVDNFVAFVNWAENQPSLQRKKSHLLTSILQANEDTWIDLTAYNFVGVGIAEWSDTTFEMFKEQLLSEFQAITKADDEDDNYIRLALGDKEKSIAKVELSTKSQTIYKNVQRIIKNAGRTVPKDEVEYLIYSLIEEFVE